jgi:hypothetical protein
MVLAIRWYRLHLDLWSGRVLVFYANGPISLHSWHAGKTFISKIGAFGLSFCSFDRGSVTSESRHEMTPELQASRVSFTRKKQQERRVSQSVQVCVRDLIHRLGVKDCSIRSAQHRIRRAMRIN